MDNLGVGEAPEEEITRSTSVEEQRKLIEVG